MTVWNVYFPKRDMGFDFIATKNIGSSVLIRPVQVKGLYPSEAKKDKTGYGYIGTLSQIHDDMVLVLPYFPTDRAGPAPVWIAFMPRSEIRPQLGRGYKCFPAKFIADEPIHGKRFGSSLALTVCAIWNFLIGASD